jgi:hypothetical protein
MRLLQLLMQHEPQPKLLVHWVKQIVAWARAVRAIKVEWADAVMDQWALLQQFQLLLLQLLRTHKKLHQKQFDM